MKLSVLRLFGVWSIVVILALVVLASVIGLWIDVKGFVVNLLAGVVGIFLGFVIGCSSWTNTLRRKGKSSRQRFEDLLILRLRIAYATYSKRRESHLNSNQTR